MTKIVERKEKVFAELCCTLHFFFILELFWGGIFTVLSARGEKEIEMDGLRSSQFDE